MVANVNFCGNHGNHYFSRAYIGFFHGRRLNRLFLGYAVSCAMVAFLGGLETRMAKKCAEDEDFVKVSTCRQEKGSLKTGNPVFRLPFFRLRITELQVKLVYRIQIVIQFIHQRLPRGDFQRHDAGIGNALYMFGQRAQTVAVRRHQHPSACQHGGRDLVVPKGQHPFQRYFQVFAVGYGIGGQMGIAAVVVGGKFVIPIQKRRQHIIASAPDAGLFFSVFLSGLLFVQPLQRAIMPLVQPLGFHLRHKKLAAFFQHDVAGFDGTG